MIHSALENLWLRFEVKPWQFRGFKILLGALLALGHAPISVPLGVFIAIPLLGYFGFRANTWKAAFAVGWWAGFGYFGLGFIWLVEPFFVEPEKHAILAPIAMFLTASGFALFWAAAFVCATYYQYGRRSYVIGLSILWTMFEYIRSVLLTGFPWGLLGYVWADTPVAQWAAVFGPFGLVFVTVLGGLLALPFLKRPFLGPIMPILFFAILWGFGAWRIPNDDTQITQTRVRVIQPNAPQHQKWDPDWVPVFFQRGLELTSASADQPIDLVVWPETSVPIPLKGNTGDLQVLSEAAGPNTHIIAGIRRFEQGRLYNTMIHLDQRGGLISLYDKHHLVPFGEYFPLANYLPRLGLKGMAANLQGFSPGTGPKTVSALGLPTYLPLICYEAIFPYATRVKKERPDFMLHITNDAWFGDYIGPYQHLAQVRLRAIEQGLPVIRSANTGISAIIDPYGRVTHQLKLNTSGYLDADLPVSLMPTIYAKSGDWPVLSILVFIAFAVALTKFLKSSRTQHQE